MTTDALCDSFVWEIPHLGALRAATTWPCRLHAGHAGPCEALELLADGATLTVTWNDDDRCARPLDPDHHD